MTTVQVKVVNSGPVMQSIYNIGEAIPRVVNADIESVMNEARAEMATPGQPVAYPIHWDSEKQRRAAFATQNWGAGMPYNRTGHYGDGWVVDKTGFGTSRAFSLSNKWDKAKYVGGNAWAARQSNIHKGRWPLVALTVAKYAQKLIAVTSQAVHDAIAQFGGGL